MKKILLGTLLGLIASNVMADNTTPNDNEQRPNWNYVQLTSSSSVIDIDGENVDYIAGIISGSVAMTDNIAFISSFSGGEIQTSELCYCTDIDTTTIAVGIAAHFSVNNKTDIVIPVSFGKVELDDGFENISETGYTIGVGFRSLIAPKFEISAGVNRADYGEATTSVSAGARFHITSLISLALGIASSDEVDTATFDIRFSF